MDEDTQMAATIAAKFAMDNPPLIDVRGRRRFEEGADEMARQCEPADEVYDGFRSGLERCREIIELLGFKNPSEERVLIVAVFAAQGLAFARSIQN